MITRGRPTGHEPANKGKTMPGTKKPAPTRTASYTVRALFDMVDAGGIAYAHLADQSGYNRVTVDHGRRERRSHAWLPARSYSDRPVGFRFLQRRTLEYSRNFAENRNDGSFDPPFP